MLAVVEYDATRRQQVQKSPHRLAHYRNPPVALIAAPGDHEDLARSFDLLSSQPVFSTPDRLGSRWQ